ncbi:MAG: 50S ribosomal protein L24 [Candidatus Woesearchaeota archaeon]|jgi:large subunit ribosomal protein L24|nr:50S ribosomal protein L24 [Candidatus Woesearchaeota archaeon]MDP7181768.1 50S ribosomal protein L24 [Candidatus Woesearchaeota archaeon]MDP7198857.1 50S ribosomal protein L24 [Candidatus Woesearchaeota archaeon]MDP7467143.1 50S ribosomal protein L24 [Candidatus Woesearchaeota archaeon]MDP7647522.1 50S ribosomal protein L24 [Candidatus Woesearchaeota archaeon]
MNGHTKGKKRSIRIKKGMTVKVARGQHKGKQAKVAEVNTKKSTVYLEGIEVTRTDGQKAPIPIHTSNLFVEAAK